MRRMQGLLAGLLALAVTGLVQAGESYHVVKIKRWDKEVTYEVMADADLQKVLAEQKTQAKYASKAADLAKAAWQKDESTKGKPFPQKVLALPLYTKVGTFSSKETADDKLYRSLDNQREDEAAKSKAAGKSKKKVDPREVESEYRQRAARASFEAKLTELMTQPTKPAAEVAVEAEAASNAK